MMRGVAKWIIIKSDSWQLRKELIVFQGFLIIDMEKIIDSQIYKFILIIQGNHPLEMGCNNPNNKVIGCVFVYL